VAAWLQRTGQHCQQVHQHLVQQGQVDLQHVQADELWVKLVGQRAWQAMALAVPSRLWLGGVISPQRDTELITALVRHVRACATSLGILVCVDGLATYLRHGLPPSVPAPRPHRAPRPPALGGRARPADRAAGQTLRPAPGGEHQPAGRARDGRGDRGRAGRDRDRDGHPHRLDRAAQRDFPQPSDTPGPPRSRDRPHGGHAGRGQVAGRHELPRLLVPRQSPPGGAGRERTQVVGADAGHGGGTDGPPLDASRPAALPGAPACLGGSQAAWPPAQARPPASNAAGSLTPIPCGATAEHRAFRRSKKPPESATTSTASQNQPLICNLERIVS